MHRLKSVTPGWGINPKNYENKLLFNQKNKNPTPMKLEILAFLSVILFSNCNNYKISNMNTIKGNGNIIEKTISISGITNIENTGIFNVYIKQGDKEEVKIETDGNIIEYFKYKVEIKSILISNENINLFPTKANVYITTKTLNSVKNSGSGNINVENYVFSSLFTSDSRGSGNFTMTNTSSSKELLIKNEGSGNINVDNNIFSSLFTFENSGSGNYTMTDISSSDELLIKNDGSGNVNIKGKTKTLNLVNSGSGDTNTFELIAEFVNTKNSGSGNIKVYCEKELTIKNSGSGDLKYKGNATIKEVSSSGSGNVSKVND